MGFNIGIFWIASGQVISLICNFLLLKVLTANLSMLSYGHYTLWMAVLLFIRQIVYDPISIISAKESIERKILKNDEQDIFQIVRYVVNKLFISIFLFGIAFVFIEILFFERISISVYILAGVIYLVSNGAQGIYLNVLNTLKNRKLAAAGIAADSITKLFLVYFAILFFGNDLVSTLHAVALSSLFVFIWVRSMSKRFYNTNTITAEDRMIAAKQLFTLSLPLLLPTLVIAIKSIGDKVFMASFIGAKELAAYNVLLQLGFMPMMVIVGIIQTYTSPDIYKSATCTNGGQKKAIKYINFVILKILALSAVAVGVSTLLFDFIFKNLVGEEYSNYSKFLPYFVIAGSLSGITGLLNVGVVGAFKPKLAGVLMFISVLSGLIIQMVLIVMYRFEGGIAGLVFSNLAMMLIFFSALWLNSLKINK